MKYQIVGVEVGLLNEDNVLSALEVRGFSYAGMCTTPVLREELQGQPVFSGLMGPMWGGEKNGEPVIRYETPEVYKALSTD